MSNIRAVTVPTTPIANVFCVGKIFRNRIVRAKRHACGVVVFYRPATGCFARELFKSYTTGRRIDVK